MSTRFRIRVRLWMVAGQDAAFRAFEDAALEIMRAHDVEVMAIERPGISDPAVPDEIHVLDFPSREVFDAYRADSRLARLKALRQQSVSRTEIEQLEPPADGRGA